MVADALGEDAGGALAETEAALAANGTRPRVTLCVVPGLADPGELVAAGAEPAAWSPYGAYLAGGDPGRDRGGQRPARGRPGRGEPAGRASRVARGRPGPAPDCRWLDLCAGPGGKARLLAGLAAQRGSAPAGHGRPPAPGPAGPRRGGGHRRGSAAAVDATAPAWRAGAFDRVLADVPCSGIGALRRRPEARWRRSAEDVLGLAGLQRSLLRNALDAVRPGGVVGYVTCSPHRGETRDVLVDVLRGRHDIEVLDAPAVLAEVPGLRCPEPDGRYAQFWPHRHGTDAIFLALLRRREDAGPG